ncbi:polyprenyl synthetase family protein [Pseudonocardia sp. TRM90224]|uniref:polyprenyl synthetase family protein n=1 Tax=Pseudonocardia sp. TRM90224 TaxID=2812678 RepID=UPI001E305A04|nr:polyprenyl synthetase family protein [Pseudonocardia sp. TRM90224]
MTILIRTDHPTATRSERLLRAEIERRWPAGADDLTALGRYALLPPGKLLRPLMTLACAEAVGGDPDDVLPAALAMEYVHVATLVHDDIIDGDDVRRSRPSVHAAHGVPDAIVTGDHLIFAAFEAIATSCSARLPAGATAAAVTALAAAGSDLCRGQVLESRLVGDPTVDVDSCLAVAKLKTGALFRAVCEVGALLGGADGALATRLGEYGELLGITFQIRDDLLACTLTSSASGKPVTSDLANGRPTLPVLLAYQAAEPATRRRLAVALTRRSARPGELAAFRAMLAETGGLDLAREQAAHYGEQALARLGALDPSGSRDVLESVVTWAARADP